MNERGRRFSHLSWHNRLKIDKMLKEGYKAQEIADALHVHNSTIYREIKRGLTVQRTSELVKKSHISSIPILKQKEIDGII
mgnify:CR=1 FL=1